MRIIHEALTFVFANFFLEVLFIFPAIREVVVVVLEVVLQGGVLLLAPRGVFSRNNHAFVLRLLPFQLLVKFLELLLVGQLGLAVLRRGMDVVDPTCTSSHGS